MSNLSDTPPGTPDPEPTVPDKEAIPDHPKEPFPPGHEKEDDE